MMTEHFQCGTTRHFTFNPLFQLRFTGHDWTDVYHTVMYHPPPTLQIPDPNRHLQAAALVRYKVREVCQGKAVPEVKQCHDVWSQLPGGTER